MLSKVLEILSIWSLLGLVVGLLAVNIVTVSPVQASQPDAGDFPLGDRQTTALSELGGNESLPPGRA